MKSKTVFASLIFLAIAALAFYIDAQVETREGRDSSKYKNTGPYVVGRGIGPISTEETILLQAKIGEDGKADYVQIIPPAPHRGVIFRNGKLRIEMLDGSVQEFELEKVKRVTIE